MRRLAAWMVAAMLALAPAAALAKDNKVELAKQAYQDGETAYNLGDFAKAVEHYKRAYELSNRAPLLFNIAQSYRLSSDFKQALFFYQSFLRNLPDAPNRAEVERRIDEMQKAIDQAEHAKQPPNGTVSPDGTPTAVTTTTTTTTTTSAPGTSDTVTHVPTPAETAAASPAGREAATPPSAGPTDHGSSRPIYKKWWFWTGIGAVAAVAVVAVAAHGSGGGSPDTHFPTTPLFAN